MKEQLYLSGELVDLLPTEKPAFTFQINDLYELATRQASRTNKFKLPKTKTNRKILDGPEYIYSVSRVPYQKVPCRYIKDGIEIIPYGYAILEQSDEYYNVTIYAGNINFFDAIDGKSIRDLNLSDLNHYWDLDSIWGLRYNDAGICYPIVAYTEDTAYINDTSDVVDVRRLLPFIFVHTLVERIVSEAGFSLASDSFFKTNEFFKKLILQVGNEKWNGSGKILHATKTNSQTINISYSYFIGIDDDYSGDPVFLTGNFDPTNVWQDSGIGYGLDQFMVTSSMHGAGGFALTFFIHGSLSLGSGTWSEWTLKYRVIHPGGYSYDDYDLANYFIHIINPATRLFSGEFVVPNNRFTTGDIIRFFFTGRSDASAEDTTVTVLPGTAIVASILGENNMTFGAMVDVAANLPDISQKDFLKGIAQMMAITFDTDTDSQTLKHKTFEQVCADKVYSKDITDLIDDNDLKTAPVNYRIGSYAQKNWMKYKEDENVLKGYGDYYFQIPDDILEKEKTLFTLPFGATQSRSFLGGRMIPFIKRWDNSGKLSIKTSPRILILDGIDLYPSSVDTVTLTDGVTSYILGPPNPVPYAHFLHQSTLVNLGFGNSLIRDWYTSLISCLTDAKKITPNMKLSPIFIENMDMLTPVYSHQLAEHFYLNKITNWDGESKCKVELIKIEGKLVYPIVSYFPELIQDNDFNTGFPWTAYGTESGCHAEMTGGKLKVTMGAYTTGAAGTNKGWMQDIVGLDTSATYQLQIKTGHVDPYFNTIEGMTMSAHGTIQLGLATLSPNTVQPLLLLPNHLYIFTLTPTGTTPPASTFYINFNVTNTTGHTDYSGGEYMEIESVSLKKI